MSKENDVRPENTPENEAVQPQTDAAASTEAASKDSLRYTVYRSASLTPKSGYILRKVGQAHMIMPTGPRMKDYQGMITLNETGAFLFKEIGKPEPTVEKLISACVKEYGATEEEANRAVLAFVKQCTDCGLLEYQERVFDKVENRELTEDEYKEYKSRRS